MKMDAVKMDALVVLTQRLNVYVFYWSLLFFLTRFLSSSIFSTTRSTYSLETESRSFSMKKQILTTILIGFKIESKYFVHYCGYIDGNWMVGVHRRNRGFG